MVTVTEPSPSVTSSSTVAIDSVVDIAPLGIVSEVGSVAGATKAPVVELPRLTARDTSSAIPRLSSNTAGFPSVTAALRAVMVTVDRSSSAIVPVAVVLPAATERTYTDGSSSRRVVTRSSTASVSGLASPGREPPALRTHLTGERAACRKVSVAAAPRPINP